MSALTRCRIKTFAPALALLSLLFGATPAHANITCSGTSMSVLDFSNVNPLSSLTTSPATLSYTCRNSAWLTTHSALLCFSIGEPGGGQTNPRLMSSGSNKLQFQLYQDAARTTVWGSQFFGSPTPLQIAITLGPGDTTSGTATLYGLVLGGQISAIPGSYTSSYQASDTALTIADQSGTQAPTVCDTKQENASFGFLVRATVTKQCTVAAGPSSDINLGSVPASATNVSGNGNISIACSNTTPYTVGLRPSNNSTTGAGVMSAAAGNLDKVPYQLYQNAAMTTPWGNTATATNAGNGVAGTGNGAAKSHTVYVRAPSADFQPDSYSDTVTVVVNY